LSSATKAVPKGPERLTRHEWVAALKRSAREFLADDCMGLSQQIAFSALLAFFPAVAAGLGLLAMLGLFDDVESLLSTVAPHGVLKFVDSLHDDTSGGSGVTVFVIGLLGALWAASSAMGTVIKAVNKAYDLTETRPIWRIRLIALGLVVGAAVVVTGTLVLVVFGGPLGTAIAKRAHLGGAFTLLWDLLRWPLMFCAVLLFFSLLYAFAPNQSPRNWKWLTPGSVLGGVMWLALSGLFAVYATFSGSYTKTYGTLASGVILLLWLNYSALALLLGAEFNAELDRQADINAAGGPRAGLVKPARRRR
jgi:membrane protein